MVALSYKCGLSNRSLHVIPVFGKMCPVLTNDYNREPKVSIDLAMNKSIYFRVLWVKNFQN